jgi:hypothetical protein
VVAVRADATSAAISGAELTPGTVSAQTVKKEVRNVKGWAPPCSKQLSHSMPSGCPYSVGISPLQ